MIWDLLIGITWRTDILRTVRVRIRTFNSEEKIKTLPFLLLIFIFQKKTPITNHDNSATFRRANKQ